jgi:hypothetical protein
MLGRIKPSLATMGIEPRFLGHPVHTVPPCKTLCTSTYKISIPSTYSNFKTYIFKG